MIQKHILGLDLGTNSIGWAVINASKNEEDKEQLDGINCDGVRIIPMDASVLGDFDKGNSKSQTADRTKSRSVRRLYERNKLRRERLHRILDLLGFLPSHYSQQLDRYGKFITGTEPNCLGIKMNKGIGLSSFKILLMRCWLIFIKSTPISYQKGKRFLMTGRFIICVKKP